MSHYQVTATIEALEKFGRINERGFALLRSDKELASQIGKLVFNKLCPPTDVDKELLSIMDDSKFFGPSDWLRYYNLRVEDYNLPISIKELNEILDKDCPFSIGKKIRDTHYLFYLPDSWNGVPLTIKKWQEVYAKNGKNTDDGSFGGFIGCMDFIRKDTRNPIAKAVAKKGWYLMPENLPKVFVSESFSEQIEDKPENYEAAKLIECGPMHFLIFEKNNRRINQFSLSVPCYGNTSDLDSRNKTIRAGNFSEHGVSVVDGYTIECTPMGYGSIFLYRKLE